MLGPGEIKLREFCLSTRDMVKKSLGDWGLKGRVFNLLHDYFKANENIYYMAKSEAERMRPAGGSKMFNFDLTANNLCKNSMNKLYLRFMERLVMEQLQEAVDPVCENDVMLPLYKEVQMDWGKFLRGAVIYRPIWPIRKFTR